MDEHTIGPTFYLVGKFSFRMTNMDHERFHDAINYAKRYVPVSHMKIHCVDHPNKKVSPADFLPDHGVYVLYYDIDKVLQYEKNKLEEDIIGQRAILKVRLQDMHDDFMKAMDIYGLS